MACSNFKKSICNSFGEWSWLKNWCHDCYEWVSAITCLDSKKLATPWCPNIETIEYKKGEEPTKPCKMHEPPIHMCPIPLAKIGKVMGHTPGCELAVLRFKEPYFNFKLWVEMVDTAAQFSNYGRFFGFCSEDPFYVNNTFLPFHRFESGKFDCLILPNDYKNNVGKRLNEYWKRDVVTELCAFSSMKKLAGRWDNNPLNGRNNVNNMPGTLGEFYRSEHAQDVSDIYLENLVNAFDNPLLIYSLVNEVTGIGAGAYDRWCKGRVAKLRSLGVPYERIMIEYGVLGSKIFYYLDLGIRSATHGINSVKSVKKYHTSIERWNLRENRETGGRRDTIGDGDGGDNEKDARGLVIKGGKARKASAKQIYFMNFLDLKNGKMPNPWTLNSGPGINVMSAAPFCKEGGVYPNLEDMIRIGTKGLTEAECEELGVDFDENKHPEYRMILKAYRDSLKTVST